MMKDALATIGAEILEDFDLAKEAALDGTYVRAVLTFKYSACAAQ